MPDTTPVHSLPYPVGSETPDIPRDVQALAEATSTALSNLESRSISAGAGLTGGGDLTAGRTLNVGAGSGVSVTADAIAVDTVWGDNRYVSRSGATMVGALRLPPADPNLDTEAAHKGYVDSRIWFGTQAAYDAIGTKDSAVLYCISG